MHLFLSRKTHDLDIMSYLRILKALLYRLDMGHMDRLFNRNLTDPVDICNLRNFYVLLDRLDVRLVHLLSNRNNTDVVHIRTLRNLNMLLHLLGEGRVSSLWNYG